MSSRTIELERQLRADRRLRASTVVALLSAMWSVGHLPTALSAMGMALWMIPTQAAFTGLAHSPRHHPYLGRVVLGALGVLGAGLVITAGASDGTAVAVALGLFAFLVPSHSGLGPRRGGLIALAIVGLASLVAIISGSTPGVVAPWMGALGLGVLVGWGSEDAEHTELALRSTLEASQRAMQQQLDTDRLTGLPNRHYALEWLERAWEKSRRRATRLSVMVIDIDHFKQINDAHGHSVGDVVIRAVGRTLMMSAGPNDLVGRWGGEEFVVVSDEGTPGQPDAVGEALRAAVAGLRLRPDGKEVRPTVSVGVATWSGESDLGPRDLFVEADRALYVAKETGRNRVHCVAR